MGRATRDTSDRPGRQYAHRPGTGPAGRLILLLALLLAGCQATSGKQPGGPGEAVSAKATSAGASGGAGNSSQLPAGGPSAGAPVTTGPNTSAGGSASSSLAAGGSGAAVAANSSALLDVPVLGSELAAGWDTKNSWSAQFAAGKEMAPTGAAPGTAVWTATFGQNNSGLFFSVRQESQRRYLRANYLGARVWVNPGAQELAADHLHLAVLSSDRHTYWTKDDQPVPPPDPAIAGEGRLAPGGTILPANAWSEIQIWFSKLPSPPAGRYLTGLYLRADGMAGQEIKLAGLDLLAIPDNVAPVPLVATIVDLTTLRINFNEDVDPVTAENRDNYRIGSAGDPAYRAPQAPSAVQYQPDNMSALLTVPQALKPDVEYTIEVQRIADFAPQPHVQVTPARLSLTAHVLVVKVDAAHPAHPISPFVYGIAGASQDYLKSLRPTITNWGGNNNSRYNWQLGNAWNAGSDWEYRNGDYGYKSGSASDNFIAAAQAVGADVRLTLPTLGWVAKNADNNTCSFTDASGKCFNPGASCAKPGPVADPNRANVPTDVNWVVQWVKNMLDEKGLRVRFFAFDNEPDLWGYTHYDVHPKCTTYDEILNKYLDYASAVRAVAPQAELLGPVSCCWYYYWNSAAGDADKAKHDKRDFLPWFLDQVRRHDEKAGVRTLNALDIHYYPEGFYNDKADAATAQGRLQETRSLWDKTYADPSWIKEPVNLIPRMKQVIADNYPGTKLFISEWNFGAPKTMNGALAIADVLGIYGQEDVYGASYWGSPELNSPGFFGFKMYTNYDDQGSRFGDMALPASSSNRDQVSAYASRDSRTGNTMLMLINKLPDRPVPVTLQMDGLAAGQTEMFRYSQDHLEGIMRQSVALTEAPTLTLPPYSITLLVVPH